MYIPPGFNTLFPYFFVRDANAFVTFLVMGLLYVPAALIPLVLPRRKCGPIPDHGMGQSVRASMSRFLIAAWIKEMAARLSLSPAFMAVTWAALMSSRIMEESLEYGKAVDPSGKRRPREPVDLGQAGG